MNDTPTTSTTGGPVAHPAAGAANWTRSNGLRSFALVAAVFLLLSWLRLDPGSQQATAGGGPIGDAAVEEAADVDGDGTPDPGAAAADPSAPGAATAATGPTGRTATADPAAAAAKAGLECKAGKNGGATAKGVTGTRIKLATTAVQDGKAKTLLADSVTGMKAVVDKVNRAGGICGRLLDLTVVNDSFDASAGQKIIRNFIESDYFALPVVPSAEGLGAAILGKQISEAGMPVVGSDGMREEQYGDPWVWPVASATVTSMRVMAKHGAAKLGAKSFAIVYDSKYKFGKEGKDAFVAQVRALGGTLVHEQPLDPEQSSYASEVDAFNAKCGGRRCDMVAMLLLPDTAKAWMARNPETGGKYTAGAQTLFTDRFAQDCVQAAGVRCHDFAVWTGYNPPIGAIANRPGVSSYVNDVRALNPGIDVNNQFLEGSYLGMSVFVEALKKVGPNLTRAALRQVMDSMDYTGDLSSPLTWRPGKHAANVRAQSFAMVVAQGTFNGWRDVGTGFVLDPAHGG